ncbi:ATP-dependent DNA helicase PIF1-like protein [Tanacetum coccineum]
MVVPHMQDMLYKVMKSTDYIDLESEVPKKALDGPHDWWCRNYRAWVSLIKSQLRITLSDKRLPLKIIRKQYPLSVSFAMTINKSQGQSLLKVGLYLARPVFTHGQLYVALSRVKSKGGLKVVVCDDEGNVSRTTIKSGCPDNVVAKY